MELSEFVFKMHAITEDSIFFPRVMAFRRMPDEITGIIKRLSADHLLLEKLHTNMIDWKLHGRDQLYQDRVGLFLETLVEHNMKEEEEVFSRDEVLEYPESLEADQEVWDAVKKYGVTRYEDFVGVSDSFLSTKLKLRTPFVK